MNATTTTAPEAATASPAPAPVRPPPAVWRRPKSERMLKALAELQLSRQDIRNELMPPPRQRRDGHRPPRTRRPGVWARALRRWPAMRLAGDATNVWLKKQTWYTLGTELADAVRQRFEPLITEHPRTSMAVAAAVGAGVVATRPWRWGWVRERARAVPRSSRRWMVRQLTSPAVQAALAGLVLMILPTPSRDSTSDAAPSADGPAPVDDGKGTEAGNAGAAQAAPATRPTPAQTTAQSSAAAEPAPTVNAAANANAGTSA